MLRYQERQLRGRILVLLLLNNLIVKSINSGRIFREAGLARNPLTSTDTGLPAAKHTLKNINAYE